MKLYFTNVVVGLSPFYLYRVSKNYITEYLLRVTVRLLYYYSLALIKIFSNYINILYHIGNYICLKSNFGSNMFLYIDMYIIYTF